MLAHEKMNSLLVAKKALSIGSGLTGRKVIKKLMVMGIFMIMGLGFIIRGWVSF